MTETYTYNCNTKFSASYDAWGNQTVNTNNIGISRGSMALLFILPIGGTAA